MAQVSGSALAAVIAAKLASTLGVYGTILGAGVISVIATCGGPLFQHLFKRTGEQVRDVTASAKPKTRQVPVPAGSRDDRVLMPGTLPPPPDEEFGEATVHGTRVRGWKRPAIAAALVFGVTMGGITSYELVAGEDFGGRQGTTTFGSAVRGAGSTGQDTSERDRGPAPTPSGSAEHSGRQGGGTDTPTTGSTPTREPATGTPSAEPTPSGSTDGGTTPAPTPTGPTAEPTAPTPAPTSGTGQPVAPTTQAPAPAGADAGAE
ncbi:hypothetical protein ABTY59_11090 [Streptomyces sp. NPDC096079]|uniref:hypothetical protein n=1 Tax=Streptomyces sp. NPDC096079 TaxID=3155820 RepID=UPI003333CB9C